MTQPSSWPNEDCAPRRQTPPRKLTFSDAEVHVWQADLAMEPAAVSDYAAWLSADERDRAARFHQARDRERFVAGRGLLRQLLGRYLQTTPEQLVFDYNVHGKPALAAPFADSGLQFNLAHSHDLALFAFTRGRAVGVDVEAVTPDLEIEPLLPRICTAEELAAWQALPVESQRRAFFSLWTRKEALSKALGMGLSAPMFNLPGFVPARRTEDEGSWTLTSFAPLPDYAAALAVLR